MSIFYSAETHGFYTDEHHADNMPEGVKEITEEQWRQIMAERSTGRLIKADSAGLPVTVERFDEFDGSNWVYNIQLEIAAVLPVVISEINTACKAAIEGGFVSNALGQDYSYDSELEDQVNISGNVQMGSDVYHKRIDANGDADYVIHTTAQMRQVGEDLVAHKLTQLTKAALLKGQAKAAAEANDLAALQAITWS